jgi:hypothetical protein
MSVEAAEIETPTPDTVEPCSKQNDWCILPDGHKGRCRAYPEGYKGTRKSHHKRPASTGSTSGASRRGRASKPSIAPAILSLAYARLGQAVEMIGPEPTAPPVGRVMQFQAPAAGKQLDTALSAIPLYKKVTSLGDIGESPVLQAIINLVAAPVMAGLMASNEALAQQMWPLLAAALQSAAVEQAREQKKQLQAMDEIAEFQQEAMEALMNLNETLFAPRPDVSRETEDA